MQPCGISLVFAKAAISLPVVTLVMIGYLVKGVPRNH